MPSTSRAVPDHGTARRSRSRPASSSAVLENVRPVDVVRAVVEGVGHGERVQVDCGPGIDVDAAAFASGASSSGAGIAAQYCVILHGVTAQGHGAIACVEPAAIRGTAVPAVPEISRSN